MGQMGRARIRNRLGNPCPRCGAKRYERCHNWMKLSAVRDGAGNIVAPESAYLTVSDRTHSERKPLLFAAW